MTAPATGRSGGQPNPADWIRDNSRTASIAAGTVVVLALGTWLYISSANRKEAFASQALMQARNSAESGNLPLASADLTRLVERFAGTKAADEAVILLNQTRMLQGQRDVAINALKTFVSGGHAAYVKASAYALLGGALEDAGRSREAAEAYRKASGNAELDFLKAQYLNDAARAYVAARDTTAAKAAYTETLTRFGRLDQSAEARVRLAELGGTVPPPPPPEDTATAG